MSISKDGVEYDYDYLVIVAGSGGIASARHAAGYGAKVGSLRKDKSSWFFAKTLFRLILSEC